MNIILFQPDEIDKNLSIHDPRAKHILEILKSSPGDNIKAGVVNKEYIQVILKNIGSSELELGFLPSQRSPLPLYPLTMIIGTPRPPTARRLLKDLTTLGVGTMTFTGTDLNEKSYLSCKLWKDNKYQEALIDGAQQGGSTLLPKVNRFYSLKKSLEDLSPGGLRMLLEYTPQAPLLSRYLQDKKKQPAVIALGPERGWTERELEMLIHAGFQKVILGERIIRTETAAVSSACQSIQTLYF